MLPALLALIPSVSKMLFNIIDKAVPDKDLAKKLKSDAKMQMMTQDNEEFLTHLKEAGSIIRAEASSQSWLARNWRPGLMALFGLIIFNNYVLYPYLSLFFDKAPMLEVPADMWALLKLGIGGYVVGRSGEKIVKVMKGSPGRIK